MDGYGVTLGHRVTLVLQKWLYVHFFLVRKGPKIPHYEPDSTGHFSDCILQDFGAPHSPFLYYNIARMHNHDITPSHTLQSTKNSPAKGPFKHYRRRRSWPSTTTVLVRSGLHKHHSRNLLSLDTEQDKRHANNAKSQYKTTPSSLQRTAAINTYCCLLSNATVVPPVRTRDK